ncbi:hypothetical protein [Burkholderia alba]|nr:hypothetical protein [Burkholderia alba]
MKVGANGGLDTTIATVPMPVVALINAGLIGDVSIDGADVTKLKN